jgi:ethanolamine ammonia-lyase small subunit
MSALQKKGGQRPWISLREFTPARIALGRAGGSLPTQALLEFRLAHARARDALLRSLDEEKLAAELEEVTGGKIIRASSAARNFDEYLLRPDLGRKLSDESRRQLESENRSPVDLAIIVTEGLSTLGVETHARNVFKYLLPHVQSEGWRLAPTVLVRRGRVAIEDQIGEILRAKLALIMVGERPGLIAPDSMSAYLVYDPNPGKTDADRNCISNISSVGLTENEAATKIHWLLREAIRRKISGVALKDEFNVSNKPIPISRASNHNAPQAIAEEQPG